MADPNQPVMPMGCVLETRDFAVCVIPFLDAATWISFRMTSQTLLWHADGMRRYADDSIQLMVCCFAFLDWVGVASSNGRVAPSSVEEIALIQSNLEALRDNSWPWWWVELLGRYMSRESMPRQRRITLPFMVDTAGLLFGTSRPDPICWQRIRARTRTGIENADRQSLGRV